MTIKLAGENVSPMISHISIELGIGEHSRFRIGISNEDRSSNFKGSLAEVSKKWIGKPVKADDFFDGIVTSVSLSRARAGGSTFVIHGQSPTILLDDGFHTRSFGEKGLKQIIDKVIEPYESEFSPAPDIKPQFTNKIKYCVQYRESNFQFINRLASRYGEWFYYDGKKLIFGKPPVEEEVTLNFERDLTFFDISVKTTPVNFKVLAYDYKKHTFPSQNSSYKTPENEYAKIAFEKSKQDIYPQTTIVPINLGMDDDGLEQITLLRQNVHLNELVVLSGASTKKGLRLGTVIKLVDPRSELDASGTDNYGKYIITHLTHDFQANGEGYNNHFEAIPADAAIPPLSISPDPPSCEMQTAEVIDNNDPKGMSRVRVQFIWQKEDSGDDSKTNWIRVATPQGGGGKGFYMIPEKGDQVIVAFEHNHPERAYVLTGMYHGGAQSPYQTPGNHYKVLGTIGGNMIVMYDEEGQEFMKLYTPGKFKAAAEGEMDLLAKGLICIKSEADDINLIANVAIVLMAKTEIVIVSEGDNIKISTPADILIEGQNIELKATSSISLSAPKIDIAADAQLSLKGATTSIKGSAMMDVESSGVTSVKGTIVKIN
jgi:type VI secretion system secreted protein VgrG